MQLPAAAQASAAAAADEPQEPLSKRRMSPSDKSRRWERKAEGIYLPTPERVKRQAEVPVEEVDSSRTDPVPDLLPLPPDVPRSGRTDIEDI